MSLWQLTSVRITANFTVTVAGCDFQAVLDSLTCQLDQQPIVSTRSRHQGFDFRVLTRSGGHQTRNIFRPVTAWGQEPGEHKDTSGSGGHAAVDRDLNGRLSEFHVSLSLIHI